MTKMKTPALLPFPWETHVDLGGKAVRTARPAIERVDMVEAEAVDLDTGDLTVTRARVWRTVEAPVLRAFNRARKAAILDYAVAVERATSTGGTSDLSSGGGGGGGGAKGPNLAALINAERLGRMNAALAGLEVRVPLGGYSGPDARRARAIAYRDLALRLAVDGHSPRDLLRSVGVPVTEARLAIVAGAYQSVAHILARCCGYEGETHAPAWMRNGSGSGL